MDSSGYYPWSALGVGLLAMKVCLPHFFRKDYFSTAVLILFHTVVEMGDEIESLLNDKSLVLINHQSTSDVPLIMSALDGHNGACRDIMWIMDKMDY